MDLTTPPPENPRRSTLPRQVIASDFSLPPYAPESPPGTLDFSQIQMWGISFVQTRDDLPHYPEILLLADGLNLTRWP